LAGRGRAGQPPRPRRTGAAQSQGKLRQALIVGHRPQRFPSPLFSIPDESIAFTECGQHSNRQSFEAAFPVGPFFTQYRLGI
jgi:hypothetical protein